MKMLETSLRRGRGDHDFGGQPALNDRTPQLQTRQGCARCCRVGEECKSTCWGNVNIQDKLPADPTPWPRSCADRRLESSSGKREACRWRASFPAVAILLDTLYCSHHPTSSRSSPVTLYNAPRTARPTDHPVPSTAVAIPVPGITAAIEHNVRRHIAHEPIHAQRDVQPDLSGQRALDIRRALEERPLFAHPARVVRQRADVGIAARSWGFARARFTALPYGAG